MSPVIYRATAAAADEEWLCDNCKPVWQPNENDATLNICWGDMKGLESIRIKIQESFDEITTWQQKHLRFQDEIQGENLSVK